MIYKNALFDILECIRSYGLWFHLARQDIKQRYRRSVIGPFWITIATGIMIIGMGPLYSILLGESFNIYFKYLAISFVIWNLISSTINESCYSFISSEALIKVVKLPYSSYVMRIVCKNFIIFMHNFIIILIVLFIYPSELISYIFFLIGLLILLLNIFWASLFIAIISARFRDIPQMIVNFMQILFFLTPIFWKDEMLKSYKIYLEFNPLYHLIQIVRVPLVDNQIPIDSMVVSLFILLLGSFMSFLFFSRYRSRISYWV